MITHLYFLSDFCYLKECDLKMPNLGKQGFSIIPLLDRTSLDFFRCYVSETITHVTKFQNPLESPLPDHLHQLISDKSTRLLCSPAIEKCRVLGVFERLERYLGKSFKITDEECVGREEIYWRYVRPGSISDVGPLHADGWFWRLNEDWQMPPETRSRLKVWAPIQAEPGISGLRVIAGSHEKPSDFKYVTVNIKGKSKPSILLNDDSEAKLLSIPPGDAIIFDDMLIHGGAITNGNLPRVSLEFTIAITE